MSRLMSRPRKSRRPTSRRMKSRLMSRRKMIRRRMTWTVPRKMVAHRIVFALTSLVVELGLEL